MNKRSEKILELNKIIDNLESFADSNLAKEKIRDYEIKTSLEEVSILQEETSTALNLLEKINDIRFYGVYEVSESLSFAKKGGVLTPHSILEIDSLLRCSRELKNLVRGVEADDMIVNSFNSLFTFRNIEDEINRIIISDDEIADNASRELYKIRLDLKNKNDSIKQKINSIINKEKDSSLQDSLVTMRDGRYVLPVKSEYKAKFKGIIHDRSSSGSTFFIEPEVIVNLNNEITLLKIEETKEINRILKALSSEIAAYSREIIYNETTLINLDIIFARAKMAKFYSYTKPILNDENIIHLKNAKHPLLDIKNVVPITIYNGENFTTLVITGPNTGGKTVSLKTVGLITMMAQLGLFIPCDEGSKVAIFEEVYADIGDEQSIEQSLSTFSSHMTNIVKILEKADYKSLTLFDELGAGTDPTEGAALAMAILDKLRDRRVITFATTHYSQLKVYGLTTKGVKNASVEFDLNTLSPTYKLSIGVPGKSNAFEISKRLGLDVEVIEYARDLISKENIDFENVLEEIEKNKIQTREFKLEAEKSNREIETLKRRLKIEIEKQEKKEKEIIDKAKKEANSIIKEALEEAREALNEINQIKTKDTFSKDEVRRANELKDRLSNKDRETSTDNYDFLNIMAEDNSPIELGDTVKILSLDQEGTVVEGPDNKGSILVEVGILKISSNINAVVKTKSREEIESRVNIKNIIKAKKIRLFIY